MGTALTKEQCVDLTTLPFFHDMLCETYTVIRTSGVEEDGWQFSANTDIPECACHYYGGFATKYIINSTGIYTWRFMMNNGICCLNDCPAKNDHTCKAHSHGWREIRSFWPTHLTSIQEREAWWLRLNEEVIAHRKSITPESVD